MHDARHRRVDHAGRLRQRQPHHPGAGHGHHQLRDGARHARHLHRRPSPSAVEDQAVSGRLARPLGRHHSRRRDDELHRPDQHRRRQRQRPAPQRRPQADRADLPGGLRRAPVRSAHRRSEDLRQAVDAVAAAHVASRLRAAAVRVPRRQLHAEELAQRRARRRQGDRGGCEERHHPAAQERAAEPGCGSAADPRAGKPGRSGVTQQKMAQRSRPTITKRQREQARITKQKDKAARRAERARRDPGAPASPDGVDPDIADIRPGPQPLADWQIEPDEPPQQ